MQREKRVLCDEPHSSDVRKFSSTSCQSQTLNLWATAGYSPSAIFRKDNVSYNIYICNCVR